jgi:energy-coupling factor transporter transmembrane protein EcfT
VVHCGSLFVFFLLIIVLSVLQFADGFWLPLCNFKLFYITARTNYISKRWLPHGTRPINLALFFILLAHWNNSPRVNMSLQSDTLFWFRCWQALKIISTCPIQTTTIWHGNGLPWFQTNFIYSWILS